MNKVLLSSIGFSKCMFSAIQNSRRLPFHLLNLFVKNDQGEMVPYSSFMKFKKGKGQKKLNAEAIEAAREVAKTTLPKGLRYCFEVLSYDESIEVMKHFVYSLSC